MDALEAREVPALNLFYNGADLLLTGTLITTASFGAVRITGYGNENSAVTAMAT